MTPIFAAGGGGGGYQDIEKFKLERKRERNRIAATKCRLVSTLYISKTPLVIDELFLSV